MSRLSALSRRFGAVVNAYQRALDKSPTATNALAGVVLASAGDATTQLLIERRAKFDGRRCFAFAIFTAGFAGGFYTRWYRWLDQLFGTRKTAMSIFNKIAAENFLMTPFFYFPAFFFTTGTIRGKSLNQCWDTLREQFIEVNKHSLSLWLAADLVLFAAIPVQFRPLFGVSVEFVWVNILSFITNRDRPASEGTGGGPAEPVPPRVHPKVCALDAAASANGPALAASCREE